MSVDLVTAVCRREWAFPFTYKLVSFPKCWPIGNSGTPTPRSCQIWTERAIPICCWEIIPRWRRVLDSVADEELSHLAFALTFPGRRITHTQLFPRYPRLRPSASDVWNGETEACRQGLDSDQSERRPFWLHRLRQRIPIHPLLIELGLLDRMQELTQGRGAPVSRVGRLHRERWHAAHLLWDFSLSSLICHR